MTTFKDLGLSNNILKALEKKGYTEPTEIQEKTIPLLLEGERDVIGESQTGSGKTASFALPIIEKASISSKKVQAIILAPTRELAMQVAKEFETLRGDKEVFALAVYGGSPIRDQIKKLQRGVQVVVGTPGRTIDLLKRRALDLSGVKFAVLDEADEMLNMGFIEDIESILKNTPTNKRMILFSATMPRQIMGIAKKFMRDPVTVKIQRKESSLKIDQFYYSVNPRDRAQALNRIIDINQNFYGIIFCNRKLDVDSVTHKLINSGYNAAALHGDISQPQREKILQQLRKKHITILVATDVAARGIDINDLTHVINYCLPQSPEAYTHRIGRTGRAGKEGTAITFLIPSERRKLKFIERIINRQIDERKLPSIEEVITIKKGQIKSKVHKLIESKNYKKYEEFASDLLGNHEAKDIVAALLKEVSKSVLDENSYRVLGRVQESSGRDRGSYDRGGRGRDRGGRDRGSRDRGNHGRDRGGRDSGSRDRGNRGRDRGSREHSGRDKGSSDRPSRGPRDENKISEREFKPRKPKRDRSERGTKRDSSDEKKTFQKRGRGAFGKKRNNRARNP